MKSYYLSHYFDPKNAAPFLLLSFLGLVIVLAIVLITAKIQVHQKLNAADYSPRTIRQIHSRHRKREYNLVERFFEMVFCSTSILMFLSLYYIIDEKNSGSVRVLAEISGFHSADLSRLLRHLKRLA